MAAIPDRDQTLINYPLAAPPHRNSDVDFHDVFGGPPRRHSAAFDRRQRRAGSLDSRPVGERGTGSRSSERPAFGESHSPSLRRHLGDDFFSDIFPGSEESSCSSPTRIDRDSNYPSSPGSRVLSPSRGSPLHRGNSFGGGSSLPAQLSLPMKSTKGIDQPTFNSPTHSGLYKKDGSPDSFGFPSFPSAYMQSSSTRAIPLTDDLRNDAHSSYRQSPLSRQVSRGLDKSSETTGSVSLSFEVQSQKDTTSLEDYVSSNQFHFSIYKWAGKGVTLIMPSSTKKKHDSRVRRIPEVVLHGVGLPSYNDNTPITIIASRRQSENHDRTLRDLIIDQNDDTLSSSVEEFLPVGFDSNSLHIDVTEESGNDIAPERSRRAPVTIHEGLSAEIRNPHQPFNDDKDRQGKEDVVTQVEETENISRGQKNIFNDAEAKQQAGRENSMNHVEESSPSMQDAQVPLVNGNKVKGKVKEFIKIFNYEPSPKRNGMFETQDPRSKGKDGAKGKIENQVNTSTSKIAEEVKASSRITEPSIVEGKGSSRIREPSIVEEKTSSRTESLVDTPIAGNKTLKTEKSDPTKFSDVDMINDSSSERKGTSGPFAESAPEIIDASIYNAVESHFEDFEDCLIEQLSQDKDGHLQTDQDQIKISDAKIREWAKGKEGNIRSLLSTLQYVLWEESGWKPVPLVSIIEGPSVKRAYQKALLYLHPDKLQQKGAAMHQRYIAEKVFDILQEAWDHFNSISSF